MSANFVVEIFMELTDLIKKVESILSVRAPAVVTLRSRYKIFQNHCFLAEAESTLLSKYTTHSDKGHKSDDYQLLPTSSLRLEPRRKRDADFLPMVR